MTDMAYALAKLLKVSHGETYSKKGRPSKHDEDLNIKRLGEKIGKSPQWIVYKLAHLKEKEEVQLFPREQVTKTLASTTYYKL